MAAQALKRRGQAAGSRETERCNVRILSVALGCISAFFIFYTIRLLIVTGFLQHTRAGGNGAFIGAAVFPLLALGFGWASWRLWRRAARDGTPAA